MFQLFDWEVRFLPIAPMRHIMQSCYMVYIKSIFNIYSLFCHIFNFFIFFSHILQKFCFFKLIDIDSSKQHNSHHNISEVIDYCLIILSKNYSEYYYCCCPDSRTNYIVYKEAFMVHSHRTSYKRNKSSCKVMKLSEYNSPSSPFLYSFFKILYFSLSDSEPQTIFFKELFSIVYSKKVSYIV